MLALTITNKLENQQLVHSSGPLEVGRGPKRNSLTRVVVQDGFVSRDHLMLEELPNSHIRVVNVSQRAPVAIDNHSLLTPGASCDCLLPIRLGLGETVIDVDYAPPEDESEVFLTVAAPVREEETMTLPSLLSLGEAPSVVQLIGWLEPVNSLHRTTSSKDLYTQAAQALVNRIGLDVAAVMSKEGDAWKTVAMVARDPNTSIRPISNSLLSRVEKEKRTFYLPAAAVGHGESLVGVQSVVASPVFDQHQEVVGLVSGTRSVHSRKREIGPLEAQVVQLIASAVSVGRGRFEREAETNRLRIAKDAAEEADRTKSQFLAMVSHELRTPLTTIIGYTEMLQEQAESEKLEQYSSDLGQIHTAANHLLTLINDILDLSKIEAGKVEIAREPYDPTAIVQDLMTSMEPFAKKNNNKLILNCPEPLGSAVGDATRMRQCILNLVANACKFTTNGTITVNANRTTEDDLEWLNFSVEDTGIGMTPEQMERLFQPFSQVDSSAGRKHSGTGLGLAISLKLSQAMGGTILVESQFEKGSIFTLVVRALLPKVTN